MARTAEAVDPANVSAQSPPCSRNASPFATAARRSVSRSHSPAKTSGGSCASWAVTAASRCRSGQSGCWAAGRLRQLTRSGRRSPAGGASSGARSSQRSDGAVAVMPVRCQSGDAGGWQSRITTLAEATAQAAFPVPGAPVSRPAWPLRPGWPFRPGVAPPARPGWPFRPGVAPPARPGWPFRPGVAPPARPGVALPARRGPSRPARRGPSGPAWPFRPGVALPWAATPGGNRGRHPRQATAGGNRGRPLVSAERSVARNAKSEPGMSVAGAGTRVRCDAWVTSRRGRVRGWPRWR